ncbi:MAG: plastocyanin/azurin family copper-binding protein, partial [Halobacteriota archaeon]
SVGAGAAIAAVAQTDAVATGALAQEETPTDAENGDGDDVVEVELVDYAFEPGTEEPLEIEPGTTVRFIWTTDTHNISILEAPEESDWEGVEEIEDSGFEHEHTFEVEGTYEFECVPHANLGMQGTITVGEGDGNGGAGPVGPQLPDEAMTIGIGTALALVATLGFAYVFLKYGGEPPE